MSENTEGAATNVVDENSGKVNADPPIKKYYDELHSKCGEILYHSLTGADAHKVAGSQEFVNELAIWCEVLQQMPEIEIIKTAAHEYQFGLLALVQGHYRHAFKSLRLVLEFLLQGTYLSAHVLAVKGLEEVGAMMLSVRNIEFYVPPRPQLELALFGNQLTLTWPVSAAGWSLQAADNVADGTTWNSVNATPTDTDYLRLVVLDITDETKFFFRLAK